MVRAVFGLSGSWKPSPGGLSTTTMAMKAHAVSHAAAQVASAASNATLPAAETDNWLPLTCQRVQPFHPFGSGIFTGKSPFDFSFPLFLFQVSFVIIIIHIVRFLLKPLRQPRIVAEVIGGMVIGPSLLGHNKSFAAKVFPENAVLGVKTFGVLGFMYFLFVSGVKMDIAVIKSVGRKQIVPALFGVFVPFLCTLLVAILYRGSFDERMAKISSIGAVTSSLAITAFPVLYPVLKELNLLSSEIGRQALATAIVGDVIGMNAVVAFEAMKQGESGGLAALWYLVSTLVLAAIAFVGCRKVALWVVRRTPEGEPVDQRYVVASLLGAGFVGFLTDFFGAAIANGPLWMGLALPDGPPLGATIVDRFETIVMELILPISYTFVGLYTDVFSVGAVWDTIFPLLVVTVVGYITKLIAYVAAFYFFNVTLKDSVTLSLILSLRGQVEYLLFIHWMDKEIVGIPGFTVMVLLTTLCTGIATPLITTLYNPTRPYMVHKRRTIQHTPPDAELRIVACIHDPDSVPGIINLLEVSNPTAASPFAVSALRVVELVGRAAPVFVDHEKPHDGKPAADHASDDTVHHALRQYQETRGPDVVRIHSYTTVVPRRTMYQDICQLALTTKSTFVILPFHVDCLDPLGGAGVVRTGVQSVNWNVLAHAPCSVGLLVDKGAFRTRVGKVAAAAAAGRTFGFSASPTFRLAMVFLGGADAREALAYADRMTGNPDVALTVVRFLSLDNEGDDEMEKKLDDGLVTWFWVKNEGNSRVIYREVVVRNGEETIGAIRGMNEDCSYDLWMVGRKQGINPVLLQGLTEWSQNHELGVVGDFLASRDFGCTGSVLVVQQQILRGLGFSSGAAPDTDGRIFKCGNL